MPNEPTEMFVFTDKAGNYYAFPRQVFERARVPDEYRAELEKLVRQGAQARTGELSDTNLEAVQGGSGLQSVGTIPIPSAFRLPSGGEWGV